MPDDAICALALDVDGTLLNSQGNVSPKTAQALARFLAVDDGRLLVIASARPPASVKSIVAGTLGPAAVAYAVCGEGNTLVDVNRDWSPMWRFWSQWAEMQTVMHAMDEKLSEYGGGVWAVQREDSILAMDQFLAKVSGLLTHPYRPYHMDC